MVYKALSLCTRTRHELKTRSQTESVIYIMFGPQISKRLVTSWGGEGIAAVRRLTHGTWWHAIEALGTSQGVCRQCCPSAHNLKFPTTLRQPCVCIVLLICLMAVVGCKHCRVLICLRSLRTFPTAVEGHFNYPVGLIAARMQAGLSSWLITVHTTEATCADY